jgi:hypothetical protein
MFSEKINGMCVLYRNVVTTLGCIITVLTVAAVSHFRHARRGRDSDCLHLPIKHSKLLYKELGNGFPLFMAEALRFLSS